jgi:hypothetical protein
MVTAEPALLGTTLPRLGVDLDPADLTELRADAEAMGIVLMPWQEYALAVAEARKDNGDYLYSEVADVVARQNGKSTKLAPLIRKRMREGRRILHSAQDRIIPRRIFERVALSFPKGHARVRLANGQEEVTLPNGGRYKIVAPKHGVRGNDADDLILDEIREQRDWEFMFAAKPTTIASANPQVMYLSNAGNVESVVLNDLRQRRDKDPALAYLEWSADMDLDAGDVEGWAQANPALGYGNITLERLRTTYESFRASGNMAGWETEHLCRWVVTDAPRLVLDAYWSAAHRTPSEPLHPAMGIGVSPDGSRASAALSWAQGDGSIGLMSLADVTGAPIDVDAFGLELREAALEAGVEAVAYDPWTDQHLARFFPEAKPLTGTGFANATEKFVRSVETGQLQWDWADRISEDMPYTARKAVSASAFIADRADAKRPITGALAAIRAVWLAGEPLQGPPTIW